jgi:hypothetical protein
MNSAIFSSQRLLRHDRIRIGRGMEGFRPVGEGQHKTSILFTELALGEKYEDEVYFFDKMRTKRKNFSKVLDAIPETVAAHKCYKRFLGKASESNFRYVFSNRDDSNREMILSVLAFDVPEKEA